MGRIGIHIYPSPCCGMSSKALAVVFFCSALTFSPLFVFCTLTSAVDKLSTKSLTKVSPLLLAIYSKLERAMKQEKVSKNKNLMDEYKPFHFTGQCSTCPSIYRVDRDNRARHLHGRYTRRPCGFMIKAESPAKRRHVQSVTLT